MSSRVTVTGFGGALAPSARTLLNGTDAGRRKGLHGLLHVPRDEVDDRALEPEEIARRHDDDRVERESGQRLLDRVAEILEDEEDLRAGILELPRQLARRCRAG